MRLSAVMGVLPTVASAIREERLYREYVCISLQNIPQGKWLMNTYKECLTPRERDDRDMMDIARDIAQKAGVVIDESI